MMNHPKLVRLSLAMVMVFTAMNLQASIISFANKNAFLNATSASSATGPLPNLGFIPGLQATVGTATFTISSPGTNLAIGAFGVNSVATGDWYPLPGHDLAIGGSENLNIDFSSPVFSAGFEIIEPDLTMPLPYGNSNNPFGINSIFTVTLKSGSVVVDSFTFDAPDDVASFVGVWSDVPFDRMEIREITGGAEDEYFGEVFTGVQALPQNMVPTLSQWGLILFGLILLCLGAIAIHKFSYGNGRTKNQMHK